MSRQYCAQSTHLSFEDFANTAQPWDLLGELAAQRALVVEFRQSLEESGEAKAQEFFQDTQGDIVMALRMAKMKYPDLSDDVAIELEKSCFSLVQQNFSRIFPTSTRLSGKDAETMGKLLSNIVVSAEKYKKIFDGITIGLDMDSKLEALLIEFVTKYVLPNISVRDRMAVSNSVLQFLPQLQAPNTGHAPLLTVVK